MRRHLPPRNATPAAKRSVRRSTGCRNCRRQPRRFAASSSILCRPSFRILILEYRLGEIEDFFDAGDWRRILREGIIWQRLRGTPAAIHRGLSWIDTDGTTRRKPGRPVQTVVVPAASARRGGEHHLRLADDRNDPGEQADALRVRPGDGRLRRARLPARRQRLNGGGLLNSWSGVRRARRASRCCRCADASQPSWSRAPWPSWP